MPGAVGTAGSPIARSSPEGEEGAAVRIRFDLDLMVWRDREPRPFVRDDTAA
jgi:hypothetical protein